MDPERAVEDILELAGELADPTENLSASDGITIINRLIENCEGLKGWLDQGGFTPKSWSEGWDDD